MNSVLEAVNSAGRAFVACSLPMLIQSGVLIVVLLLADLVWRRKVRAVFRYWIWMLVLVKLILPTSLWSPVSVGTWFGGPLAGPALSRGVESNPIDPQPTTAASVNDDVPSFELPRVAAASQSLPMEKDETGPIASASPAQDVTPAATVSRLTPGPSLSWQGLVLLVWAVVVIALLLLLLQRAAFIGGLAAKTGAAGPELTAALDECRRRMQVRQVVAARISPYANSPAVCGLLRPTILIPQGLTDKLQAHEVRAVLMHELAHVKRGDLWVNLVQTLLQVAYFYHPLLWLANAVIRRVREQAVDETVLVAMGESADEYPQTLVNIARVALANRPTLTLRLIGVVESKSALTARIKHILAHPVPKSARLGLIGFFAILALAVVLLPMAKGSNRNGAMDVNDIPGAGGNGSEPNDPTAQTITLERSQILDLASERLSSLSRQQSLEELVQAVQDLQGGDLWFDYPMLYLVRGADAQTNVETITGPFKGCPIDQNLPRTLIVTTREGRQYEVRILSTDGRTCTLEYSSLSPGRGASGGAPVEPNAAGDTLSVVEPVASILALLNRWLTDVRSGRLDAVRRAYTSEYTLAERDLKDMQEMLSRYPNWRLSPIVVARIDGAAMAVSNRQDNPPAALVWTLKAHGGGWGIVDIDYENPDGVKQETSRFLQSYPGATWYTEKSARLITSDVCPDVPSGYDWVSLRGDYWRMVPAIPRRPRSDIPGPWGDHALSFDGVDDCVIVPPSPSLSLRPPFLIELWIRPDFSDPRLKDRRTQMALVRQGQKVDNPPQVSRYQRTGFATFLYAPDVLDGKVGGGAFLTARDGGGMAQSDIFGTASYSLAARPGWTHVCIESQRMPWVPSVGEPLVLGQNIASYGVPYKGQIAEIRVWSKNLSTLERHWYDPKRLTGNEPNLVACWTFDESSGQIVRDLTPNHNDAYLGHSADRDDGDPKWVDVAPGDSVTMPGPSNRPKDANGISVALPNGVTVTLLGLFAGSRTDLTRLEAERDLTWWYPDGTPAPAEQFASYVAGLVLGGELGYGYLLVFAGNKNAEILTTVSGGSGRSGDAQRGSLLGIVSSRDNQGKQLPPIGDIKVTAVKGPFKTVEIPLHPKWASQLLTLEGGHRLALSCYDTGVRVTTDTDALNIRLNCKDANQTHHLLPSEARPHQMAALIQTGYFSSGSSKFSQMQSLSLEYRPADVVQFRNVALRPGQNTSARAEVRTYSSVATGQTPPVNRHALSFDGDDDCLVVPASASLQLKPPVYIEIWARGAFSDLGLPRPETSSGSVDRWPAMLLMHQGSELRDLPTLEIAGRGGAVPEGIQPEQWPVAWSALKRTVPRSPQSGGFLVFLTRSSGIVFAARNDGTLREETDVSSRYSLPLLGDPPGWIHFCWGLKNGQDYVVSREPLVIGGNVAGRGLPFKGQIAEVRLWNGPLPGDGVRSVWSTSVTGNEPNLIACWTFDEGTGQIVRDLSPNHNDARLGNSTESDDADPKWVDLSREEAEQRDGGG